MTFDQVGVIVLDIDDVIYLEQDYFRSGFNHVGDYVEREIGCADFAATCQRLFDEGTRHRIFDVALGYHGIPARRDIVMELVKEYREHNPRIDLLPDAKRLLDRCYENEFPLAIISDGTLKSQTAKAIALGLPDVCDLIVMTDQWGKPYWKPHRRAFETVQKHFGVACRYAYVATNPDKDFIMPKQLGWKTIRVRREGGLHADVECSKRQDADITVASLDELLDAGIGSPNRLSAA